MKRTLICIFFTLFTMGFISAHTEVKHPENLNTHSAPLGSKENPIKVGVMLVAPFATSIDDVYHGIVIDYWSNLVHNKNWYYTFIATSPNYDQVVKETKNGKYDMVVGDFSTTYDRSYLVDFSNTFFLSKISILTSVKKVSPFKRFMESIFDLSKVLMVVFGLFLFLSILFWLLEKRSRGYKISNSLFSTSVAMISGDVTDNPSSNLNKILFIFILIVGMILQAVIIASMTDSALSSDQSIDPFMNKRDIARKTFVVVKGSYFVKVVRSLEANVYEFDGDDVDAAKFYVENSDRYAGFVTENLLAKRYVSQFSDLDNHLIVSQVNLRNDELAFIFRKDFPFKDEINKGILFMQDNNLSGSICANYIGEDSDYCVL